MNNEQLMWCKGQEDAFQTLKLFADLFFYRKWTSNCINPRLIPLVVGPTGVGKSHLVRALAHGLNMPLLRLTSSSWIVTGSRDKTTISRISDFVTTNNNGIIQVDELDKFCQLSTSDWCRHVIGEVFDLLDGIILGNPIMSDKLRRKILLVGTGTWQHLWDKGNSGPVGFKTNLAQCTTKGISTKIRDDNVIPPELLARFNSNIIVIPPPNEDDYRSAASKMGLVNLATSLGCILDYEEGVRSSAGLRWIEEQFTQLLFAALQQRRDDLVPIVLNIDQFEDLDREIPF